MNRGNLFPALGKRDAAAADYRKALEVDPTSEPARRALADMGL